MQEPIQQPQLCPKISAAASDQSDLVQNQQILAHYLLVEKRRRVLEIDLRAKGYLFDYHTHTKQAKTGQQYIFCYDFGYLRISADLVYIVQGSC